MGSTASSNGNNKTKNGFYSIYKKSKKIVKMFKDKWFRILLLFILVLCLISGGVEGTLGWISTQLHVVNNFILGRGDIAVTEDFEKGEGVKSNVRILNQGNVPVFVRAEILIYWEDQSGKVISEEPVSGEDYLVTDEVADLWEKRDNGFFYYAQPLEPGEYTDPIIERLEELTIYDDGRRLVVDVLAQSIQSVPEYAQAEAWADTGEITIPTLVYDGRRKSFTYENTDGTDLFAELKEVVPGDVITQKIIFRGENVEVPIDLYLRADSDEKIEGRYISWDELFEEIRLKVYQGKLLLAESSLNEAGNLEESLHIYSLEKDEDVDLSVVLEVPISVGNEVSNLRKDIRWIFTVQEEACEEGRDEMIECVPETGDDGLGAELYMVILAMVGLALVKNFTI